MAIDPITLPAHAALPPSAPIGLRGLLLGDSFLSGEKVAENERFPALLTRRLRARGIEMRSWKLVAGVGWSAAELSAALEIARAQGISDGIFDLVLLQIGAVNHYRGQSAADYRLEFAPLVRRAVELAGSDRRRVLVISVPDWSATPYARSFDRFLVGEQIDAFNRANREVAAEVGVRYVNITPLSRKFGDDPAMSAPDGLHPSGRQYQHWIELILPEAMAALGK